MVLDYKHKFDALNVIREIREASVLDSKFDKNYFEALDFSDVFIIPNSSPFSSRKQIDISSKMGDSIIPVPVITANMESVTDVTMAKAVRRAGGLAALHRFGTIDESVSDFLSLQFDSSSNLPILVSVGVNRDSEKRFKALYRAGARHFIIDIAHGHNEHMITMIRLIKSYPETFVIAGNIATAQAAEDLIAAGADGLKCGIGPGAACTTKNVTGVTVPQLTCIMEVSKGIAVHNALSGYMRKEHKDVVLIADGGIREIGDICKAIAAGAHFVMCGKLFAGCDESPGKGVYRGSASADVQKLYRTDKSSMPTPEGTSMKVESAGPAAQVVEHIAGGLRSAFSYVGAPNLSSFQLKSRFGYKKHTK